MLDQAALCRVRLPIGEMDKSETRAIASSLSLRTAAKKDSQDICFVGEGGYREFLHRHDPESVAPGRIFDGPDEVAEHQGVAGFTIGQRSGLGVARGERRYVVEVDAATSTIRLGSRAELSVDRLQLEQVTWIDQPLDEGTDVEVQYRAHGPAVSGVWHAGSVDFDQPQFAISPGQTAALYSGDQVLGSAIIRATERQELKTQ